MKPFGYTLLVYILGFSSKTIAKEIKNIEQDIEIPWLKGLNDSDIEEIVVVIGLTDSKDCDIGHW